MRFKILSGLSILQNKKHVSNVNITLNIKASFLSYINAFSKPENKRKIKLRLWSLHTLNFKKGINVKIAKNIKKIKVHPGKTIADTSRLEALLSEAEKELEALEPKIERLEKQVAKLQELKLSRQKLIAFKLSVKSILSSFNSLHNNDIISKAFENSSRSYVPSLQSFPNTPLMPNGVFVPETALQEASALLRRKNSINYELFRAIVLNGGRADTQTVKQYLLEHDIRQSGSGENFERVALTDISSRVNYLVRKGVVISDGHGSFVSRFGWAQPDECLP